MQVLLLNGAIASGKTTIGVLLARRLRDAGQETLQIDLDDEVQDFSPTLCWMDEATRRRDWLLAREQAARKSDRALHAGQSVVVVGPFFTGSEISGYVAHVTCRADLFLYSLTVPLAVRVARERSRGRNTATVLIEQDAAIAALTRRYGAVIDNEGLLQSTVAAISVAIAAGVGKLDRETFEIVRSNDSYT